MQSAAIVALWAQLWGAPVAPAPRPPMAEAGHSSPRTATAGMTFLGFAQSDRAAAFELALVTPVAGGGEDRYHLVQLVDIASRRLLANYRSGVGIRRHGAHGPAPSAAEFARLHPDWGAAQSAAAWLRVRRLGRFAKKEVDFKNALVRLMADPDSQFTLQVDDKAKRLDATHKAGGFGFTPIATLFTGGAMALGHFRLPPGERAERAHLKVYHSPTGHRIAAVAVFERSDARLPVLVGGAVFATPKDNPLGTTAIGSLRVIQEQSRSVESDFKSMHPRGAHNWDVYVGRWF